MTAVSVVMPVFNGAAFVEEAVRSILAQTHRELELIVVDDGSTDRTPEIVDRVAREDERVRLVERKHEGHAAAANAGIALAGGDWIARMDADDVALPQRLEVQLAWAERHRVDVCGAGLVDKFGAEAGRLWFPERHRDIERELFFRIAMLHPTMLYRPQALRGCPYRDGAGSDDFEQQVALAANWRLGNVPDLLARHRVHPAQVHITHARQVRADMRAARRRHLARLFPDAAADDEDLLEKIALRLPADSLDELERMADWLVRLAESDDPLVRRRMMLRWWTCCTRATVLGPAVARLFDAHVGRFDLPSLAFPRGLLRLRALLRAHPGGWASRAFRRLGPRVGSIG
jgi:glycosyltransferase involved in cell wall biosynthesis